VQNPVRVFQPLVEDSQDTSVGIASNLTLSRRSRNAVHGGLMNVHADILLLTHKGVPFR
jgi:hypothetical protein